MNNPTPPKPPVIIFNTEILVMLTPETGPTIAYQQVPDSTVPSSTPETLNPETLNPETPSPIGDPSPTPQ